MLPCDAGPIRQSPVRQSPVRQSPVRRPMLSISAVILSSFGVGLSYGIGYPLVSLNFEVWGAAPWLTGLAGSVPALAIFLLLPVFPRLAGRLGAVRAIVIGCTVEILCFIAMALLPGVVPWLVLRFLMGAGIALPWLVGETWINTVTTDARRGRMIALYSMAVFGGFATGPILLEAVGVTGWTPFLLGIGGAVLSVVPILAAARLAPALPQHPETSVFGAIRLAPAAMAGAMLGGLLEMSHFSLLPNQLIQAGIGENQALRLLSTLILGGIMLQFAIGWLADRLDRRRLLVALALVVAAVIATLPAATAHPALLGPVVFLAGGLLVGFYTLSLTVIGDQVRPQDLAVANAAFLIMYQAGAMIGPAVAGAAMSVWPDHGFVAAMTGGAVAGAIGIARLGRRHPGQQA